MLDEIQDCPEARTALKFFSVDGRFDVIGTGSLLGVKGYGKEPKSIPKQLSKENKKFQYSFVQKGSTASKYAGSLQWIEDAGIVTRCYNLSITELPLAGNAEEDTFKVYMCDYGLFVGMLEDGTQYDILQGNLFAHKGAIFET